MKTNFTIKLLAAVLLLQSAFFSAEAAFLTPEQSLSRAESSATIRRMPGNARFTLAHTEKTDGENFLYVFNKGDNGFIITSANDRMPAVLGYSDKGAFNPEKASPEFKWWLSQYAAEANAGLKANHIQNNEQTPNRAPRENGQC